MTLPFALSFAWRSLRRGGQRSILAMVCVAFGVLSLVALQQMAAVIETGFLVSPRVAQSGDLILTKAEGNIAPDDLAALTALGVDAYTPVTDVQAMWMKTMTSGRATIVRVRGVDPERYPLYGTLELQAPAGASSSAVLRTRGSAIITRDLAERFDLGLGAKFSVFGTPQAPPIELQVSGIARQVPDRQGLGIYFNLDTWHTQAIAQVAIRADAPDALTPKLEAAGWTVRAVPERPETQEAALFGFMLGGAGILGLLIGGIGVANTMQVLLARRTQEIATLKTLGYRQPHLLLIFGFEALMLGLIGSVFGAAVGLLLAKALMNLLQVSIPFLLEFRVQPSVVLGGLLVGILTTLIFGLVAIVRASHVRPSLLLREMELEVGGRQRAATMGLYALLILLFGILSSVVLGSLPIGFGVVAGGIVGLALLGLVLGAVLHVVVRVPLGGFPLLGMARRNLAHQRLRSLYGLVALFVGVVAIGFASVALDSARGQLQERHIDLTGVNVRMYASRADEAEVRSAITAAGVATFYTEYVAEARMVAVSESLVSRSTSIFGRSEEELRWNLVLTDSLAIPYAEAAYGFDREATQRKLALGDTLHLRNEYGAATVRLAGIYRNAGGLFNIAAPPRGMVVPSAVAHRLGKPAMPVQVSIAADPSRVTEVAEAIGRAVPQSVIIGKDALADAINRLFEGLFWFAAAVAGLALVAGAVLIANAVGLSMLERKRELGVLKAIGYSSRDVLWTVLLENGVLGLIGGATGIVGLLLTILVVNLRFPSAALSLGFVEGLLLIVVAVAFAMLSALCVAWHPTRVRPLTVLRAA